jgi:two-component system cell cycle response regulator DivK
MADVVKPAPRILIVDDYADAREMYREFLVSSGYEVMEAADGQEALEKLASTNCDLVVLDLALPKIDGMKVLEALRESSTARRLPVVVLSASFQPAVRDRVLHAGADLCLTKPCLPEDLEAAIRALVPAPASPT